MEKVWRTDVAGGTTGPVKSIRHVDDGADDESNVPDSDAAAEQEKMVARKKGGAQARRDREAGNGRGNVSGAREAEIVTCARAAAETRANQWRVTPEGPFRESNLPFCSPNLANYPQADPFSDSDAMSEQKKMIDRKKNGAKNRRDREAAQKGNR